VLHIGALTCIQLALCPLLTLHVTWQEFLDDFEFSEDDGNIPFLLVSDNEIEAVIARWVFKVSVKQKEQGERGKSSLQPKQNFSSSVRLELALACFLE